MLRAYATHRGLRVFSPDELASNRLAGIVGEPWVLEALAEEVLLGWLAGWTASGRPGVLVSYEAFAPLLTTGIVAHLKQRRLTPTDNTWPSVNLLLTSYGWHNIYTHGDPSLATALLATADPAVHVFTPADPTRVAAVLDEALQSQGRVNLIVAGGNRGILEAAIYELRHTHQINIYIVHPSSLSTVRVESPLPEVHAGTGETSVMLALAPGDVHLDRIPDDYLVDIAQRDHIRRLVLDRATTWPWDSNDPRISRQGITGGDPRAATAELGEQIINSALDACAAVLDHLTATDP